MSTSLPSMSFLQIDHNGEELLLPAAEELILSADHENKTLAVSVPEGLLDLWKLTNTHGTKAKTNK